MAITYHENAATCLGVVSVEDAEPLLAWLVEHQSATVNLAACTHLHAAALQVLMAAGPAVCAWPANEGLAAWLASALPDFCSSLS